MSFHLPLSLTLRELIAQLEGAAADLGDDAEVSLVIRPKQRVGIGTYCDGVLQERDAAGKGLAYEQVLERVRGRFPDARTTVACLRWYETRLRKAGVDVPKR